VNPARATGATPPLTRTRFEKGLQVLVARDADLARVTARFGPPPLWRRKPCFATLVRIILEQQVSLASARAVYDRLATMVVPFSAANFRRLSDHHLQKAGLTRQKRSYGRDLAEAVASGRLRLKALASMPDDDARRALMRIRGIGPWTADIYLLMALGRPNIWPRGDLALNNALVKIKNLKGSPPEPFLAAIADHWRPWRAVAARILWHYYLALRGQTVPEGF
jgi:DNA-3-methyladenine glycosylase II